MAVKGPPGYESRYDYRVDILRRRNLVTAKSTAGVELARSERTLLIDEQNHGLVFYFPRRDIDMALLEPMPEKTSHCPYKGDASYWQLKDAPGEAVAWSYDQPFPQVAQIAGHIAFYQDRVNVSLGIAAYLS